MNLGQLNRGIDKEKEGPIHQSIDWLTKTGRVSLTARELHVYGRLCGVADFHLVEGQITVSTFHLNSLK